MGDDQVLCLNLDAISSLPPPPSKLTGSESRPDYKLWLEAATTDMLAKRNAYSLVDRTTLPPGTPVVGTRFRFTYKWDPLTGTLPEEGGHRARWIALGFTQQFSKNYWQTYMATTKAPGIRIFACKIAQLQLETEHVDIVKAFTRNKINDLIYVEQPEKFSEGGKLANGKN